MATFSKTSTEIDSLFTKKEKLKSGIFFTPTEIARKMVTEMDEFLKRARTLLEPSCGSGEFVKIVKESYSNLVITAVEKEKKIYNTLKGEPFFKGVDLVNQDFLKFDEEKKFDVVLGNPPYFLMKKSEIEKSYHGFFDFKPNIFALFLVKCCRMLNKKGVLSFLLPCSFLNSGSYRPLRKWLVENYKVLNCKIIDDERALGTTQKMCILTLKSSKKKRRNNSLFHFSDNYVMGSKESIARMKHLSDRRPTLAYLGFEVKTGTVEWDKVRNLVSNDEEKTLILYGSDVSKKNTMEFHPINTKKEKRYIDMEGVKEEVILVNRGTGKRDFEFNFALLDIDEEYVLDRHLLSISHKDKDKYEDIIDSFSDERTQEFASLFCNNGSVSVKEIKEIFPLFIKKSKTEKV